jgi:Fe-S cluster biogenesis protein NfuA
MTEAAAPRVTREQLQAVLDEYVLPYVRNHGGDVFIDEIDAGGAITCRLEGACRGCPAAPVTSVAVIERALQLHLDPGIALRTPQLSVSNAALARIRSFYPDRVTGSKPKSR